MNYRITGLSQAPFRHLFGLTDDSLAAYNVKRYTPAAGEAFPDRIALSDAPVGQSVLLVNYVHQPADTPYRASHAIFVREDTYDRFDAINQIPPMLLTRVISLRAFGVDHMLVDADLADGAALEAPIQHLLANPDTAYIQAHFAKQGCYAARIERV